MPPHHPPSPFSNIEIRNLWQERKGRGRERYLREASAEIERRPVTWPYLRRFLTDLRPVRWQVTAALVLMPLAAAGGALMPVASKVLFDGVIPLASGRSNTLAGSCLLYTSPSPRDS